MYKETNYNAFPELQTKFFHKQCVTWAFPPSLNEFITLSTFSKFLVQLTKLGKTYNKKYLPLRFSKYNETSPKPVYS